MFGIAGGSIRLFRLMSAVCLCGWAVLCCGSVFAQNRIQRENALPVRRTGS